MTGLEQGPVFDAESEQPIDLDTPQSPLVEVSLIHIQPNGVLESRMARAGTCSGECIQIGGLRGLLLQEDISVLKGL